MPQQQSNRVPQHSTGWRVGRLLTDRAGKNATEAPSQWGKHRAVSSEEAIRIISQRVTGIAQVHALTRR